MSFRISLPQELINEVIDNLSRSANADVEACSLVSKRWAYPARKRLFHHIRVYPGDIEGWLSRPPESVQRMAPHIFKFELSDYWTSRSRGVPPFLWDDSENLFTPLIASLATSPVRWLRIKSFGMGGFGKATLEQCFEPICRSLRSLEMDNLTAYPDAARYFFSLFPNLDDLHIGNVLYIPMLRYPPPEWAECGTKHSPRFSGTLRFSNTEGSDDSELLAGIASLSPKFRTISFGVVRSSNWETVRKLMEACAETLEEVPLLWWRYTGTERPVLAGFLLADKIWDRICAVGLPQLF